MKRPNFDRTIIAWSVASLGLALILFWLSQGTAYSQLAAGLLTSAVVLAVALLVFETLWWGVRALWDRWQVQDPPIGTRAGSGKDVRHKSEPPPRSRGR
ncbi:MAG TPA: hypothetical protein VKW08_08460 [Xanthobacteraceae bacterium]|jgi:hypothetical protein|nr:hypothetical protein [Xanthobacteraceae bacterium]